MFHTIWVHLGPFGCLTKLGAKRAELVQKFVPRSRVRIFRNERSRSIPEDPKLMFWCVLFNLGALRTVWLRYETRCKTGRTSTKVGATKSRRNFSQRTHPIHPIMHPSTPLNHKLMFWCVSYYLGAFGSVWLPYKKLGAKRVELVLKLVPQSHVGIFCNECS